MDVALTPFCALSDTVGWQTTSESKAYRLPALARAAPQVYVFNATAGQPLYAYVAFGGKKVVARPWTAPPPAVCDLIIGPDARRIITLTPHQVALALAGKLWAAACLYQGAGGIYFTFGQGM